MHMDLLYTTDSGYVLTSSAVWVDVRVESLMFVFMKMLMAAYTLWA